MAPKPERPAPSEPATPASSRGPNLDFLFDADAFRQRFVLAEVLGPPRALRPHRRGGRK